MIFNSLAFITFFPTFFILYWGLINDNKKSQNILVIIASYIFYGWWDWRFLFLIFFSSVVDYSIGLGLSATSKVSKRKFLLGLSLSINLGLLGFFKYFNFFIENFNTAFGSAGINTNISSLNIILPVGISFYTFQTMSYTIDIYRNKIKPTKDIFAFIAFISFFPQLVAGPIERASHLLPQFLKNRKFDYKKAVSGIKLIVFGFFKKIVIADNSAQLVNEIFQNYPNESYLSLIMGTVLFAFQIYCDFSGYSDIAIGLSRILGFDLMYNFKFPYLSSNIREFWNRWHISLSSWFRDYVYIPLGGNKVSQPRVLFNTFCVFIISGFWHGANWTFVFWGVLHALFFMPIILFREKFPKENFHFSLKKLFFILVNFGLVCLAWVFFRAENIQDALLYIRQIFSLAEGQSAFMKTNTHFLMTLITGIGISILLTLEMKTLLKQKKEIEFSPLGLVAVILLTLFLGAFKNQADFIYFQF
ncbi:MAG: MBOAT family protein [Flavobacteriaceae bacterium]|nr:MBOAT family protein [Flavobacteriaceae bacterium]